MNESTSILGALASLEAAIREQTAMMALHSRAGTGTLRPADRKALALLLPAISELLADGNFLASELITDRGISPKVAAALVVALGSDEPGRTRRLGRLLARAEGHAICGFRVDRLGEFRKGVLWSVTRLPTAR